MYGEEVVEVVIAKTQTAMISTAFTALGFPRLGPGEYR